MFHVMNAKVESFCDNSESPSALFISSMIF